MDLTFKNEFVIDEEYKEELFVTGHLKCMCGSEEFHLFHTGKQTKGIFAPHIVKTEKQIYIEAVCCECNKTVRVYDSSVDGEKPVVVSHPDKSKLVIKDVDRFRPKILLSYTQKENYLTNKFYTMYIHGVGDKKEISIYEE